MGLIFEFVFYLSGTDLFLEEITLDLLYSFIFICPFISYLFISSYVTIGYVLTIVFIISPMSSLSSWIEVFMLWYVFIGRHGLEPKKRILTQEKSIFGWEAMSPNERSSFYISNANNARELEIKGIRSYYLRCDHHIMMSCIAKGRVNLTTTAFSPKNIVSLNTREA